MTGWELYDSTDDWWVGIAWGEGGHDVIGMTCPIPAEETEPYFS